MSPRMEQGPEEEGYADTIRGQWTILSPRGGGAEEREEAALRRRQAGRRGRREAALRRRQAERRGREARILSAANGQYYPQGEEEQRSGGKPP